MAPDPDKMGNVKGRKKGKQEQPGACKYKFYEKRRRDIINEKMDTLAQLIPTFDKEWRDIFKKFGVVLTHG
jgi:hypothetical protein